MAKIMFLDFEASSLEDDSWPIELGICWLDNQEKLRTDSKLIKPHSDWKLSAWSEASQRVHGIGLQELETAEQATDVARWALERLSEPLLLSDAPDFDLRWLNRLLATIDVRDTLIIESIQKQATAHFEGDALAMFFKAYTSGRFTHRAAADALRLGQAWRSALRKQQKRTKPR